MNAESPVPPVSLSGAKAALTGATGFLGVHIARALAQAGAELAALARSASPRSRLDFAQVKWVDGDVSREDRLGELAAGAKTFVHIAGIVNAPTLDRYREVNVEGTRRAVRAARSQGVENFVLISSLAAAGATEPDAPPRREEDAYAPPTNYGRSKREAEEVLEREGGDFKKWCILRPGAIYGPYDRGFLVYFQLIGRGLRPVFGDGSRIFQPVFGPDVAEACVRALAAPEANRRAYFTVPRESFTWESFGLTLARVMDRKPVALRVPEFLAQPKLLARFGPTKAAADRLALYLPKRWEADPGRARQELGWEARTPLEQGLRQTYDWYRQAGWI